MNQEPTFSFGTDFHGNLQSIDAFLRTSHQARVDHVIFGGDIAPKKMGIRTSDNDAIPYSGNHQALAQAGREPANTLEEKGYMLVADTPLDADSLQRMAHIAQLFLSHRTDQPPALSEEDLVIIERHLAPLIAQYLHSDFGKQMLQRYIDTIKIFATATHDLTPESFTQGFVYRLKNEYVITNRIQDDSEAMSRLYFGKSGHTKNELRACILLGSQATMGNYVPLLHGTFQQAMPWMRWRQMYDHLDQYAPEKQRSFARELLRRIQEFRHTFKGDISLILGNDDDPSLVQIFDDADAHGFIRHATDRVIDINPNLHMLGYSNVPPVDGTSFDAWFKSEEEIQNDLVRLAKQIRSNARCIANIHVPPNRSPLARAMVQGQEGDYGSTSVRQFLEAQQPTLALCGHIHRAWTITNTIRDQIGAMHVFNPGDSEYDPRILIGNIAKPQQYTLITPKK